MSTLTKRARRAAALAVLLSAAAPGLAPSAQAHHSAAATAQLGLEPASARCKQSESSVRSRCNGSRVAAVTWTVSCAYETFITVDYLAARPGGKSPVELEGVEVGFPTPSGVTKRRIGAGTRVLAKVTVHCDYAGDGDTIQYHRVTASATTAPAFIPPRLTKVESVSSSFCGVIPPTSKFSSLLQAGQVANLDHTLVFNEQSMLGTRRRSAAGRRKMRLYGRGGGLSYRRLPLLSVPGASGPMYASAGARIVPRRGGRLKVWAVIGGARTNTLSMTVLRKRC